MKRAYGFTLSLVSNTSGDSNKSASNSSAGWMWPIWSWCCRAIRQNRSGANLWLANVSAASGTGRNSRKALTLRRVGHSLRKMVRVVATPSAEVESFVVRMSRVERGNGAQLRNGRRQVLQKIIHFIV